jgi:hypothetical protein
VTDLTIPAIPTLYNGVLYRSRTEARRAKFWRELGIEPDYEPQGFVTTTGKPYLPDFMVPVALGRLWVEIKGSWESDPQGICRFRTFAAERPFPADTRAALLAGPPTLDGRFLVIGGDDSQDDPLKGHWEDDTQQWRPCVGGYHFDLAYPGLFRAKFAEDGCPDDFGGDGEGRLRKAVDKARSARFGTHESDETAA